MQQVSAAAGQHPGARHARSRRGPARSPARPGPRPGPGASSPWPNALPALAQNRSIGPSCRSTASISATTSYSPPPRRCASPARERSPARFRRPPRRRPRVVIRDADAGRVLSGEPARRRGADPAGAAAGAGNPVRAVRAAGSSSWRTPPRRSRRRMARWVIVSGLVIGLGGGCSGRAGQRSGCGASEARAVHLPFEDGDLVSQGQDSRVLGPIAQMRAAWTGRGAHVLVLAVKPVMSRADAIAGTRKAKD